VNPVVNLVLRAGSRDVLMTYLLIILFFLFHYGGAQQSLFPAAIPLAVRSPYLSCWDHTTNGTALGTLWPSTSDPKQVRCLPDAGSQSHYLSLSDTWLVRPRPHRRINLFILGGRSQRK